MANIVKLTYPQFWLTLATIRNYVQLFWSVINYLS